jgi:hypothetical protein
MKEFEEERKYSAANARIALSPGGIRSGSGLKRFKKGVA